MWGFLVSLEGDFLVVFLDYMDDMNKFEGFISLVGFLWGMARCSFFFLDSGKE